MATDTSGSVTSQTNLNTGSDEQLRFIINVTGLAPNLKSLKQEHERAHEAKRRKLESFRCLVRVEIFSQTSHSVGSAGYLYCLTKDATLKTQENGKFIFSFPLDEPFTINASSLLIKTPRASGIGWSRSLVQDYTVTISMMFRDDVEMNEVLEVADLNTNDEEVVLASIFRMSSSGLDGDARRAQLKQYFTNGSITTNLNMVARIGWKEMCPWCAEEERWYTPGKVLKEHITTEHPWAPTIDPSTTEPDTGSIVETTPNPAKHRSFASKVHTASNESASSCRPVTASSTKTSTQTDKDSRRLSVNDDRRELATSVGVTRLSDVTTKAWNVTHNDLKVTFGRKNMRDQQFVAALNDLAVMTTFEAAKAAILRFRELKHYSKDLKQCTPSHIKEVKERLWPRPNPQGTTNTRADERVNSFATRNRVDETSHASAEALRSLKLSNGGEIGADIRNTSGSLRRDAQNPDDHNQMMNAKQYRPQSQAPPKPSPFQAARQTSSDSGRRDHHTSKAGNLSFNGFNTVRRGRDDRHKRVIPESPSVLEESSVRGGTRVDSGMALDEIPKGFDLFKVKDLSASRTPIVTNSIKRPFTNLKGPGALTEQPQNLSESWTAHGLPQPRPMTTTVPSRHVHALRLFEGTTLRPLLPGSEVTGYERQIDETWLRMKQDQKIETYSNMTTVQKDLMKRWNHQMLEEKLNGNKFLPDATMRFVAANKSWLGDDAAFREFVRFLGSLRADKLVTDVVVKACVDALRGTAFSPKEPLGPLTTRAKARASFNAALNVKRPESRSYLPLPEVPEAPYVIEKRLDWAATCVCGETVDGAGQIMLCSNADCANPEHHMKCVPQAASNKQWRCGDCSKNRVDRDVVMEDVAA